MTVDLKNRCKTHKFFPFNAEGHEVSWKGAEVSGRERGSEIPYRGFEGPQPGLEISYQGQEAAYFNNEIQNPGLKISYRAKEVSRPLLIGLQMSTRNTLNDVSTTNLT